MLVKELKDILNKVPDDLNVCMLSLREDNLNEGYDIENVVQLTVFKGDEYQNELVLVPA